MGCTVPLAALAAGWPSKGPPAMSDASFASLGPTLLARKGGAKPAMRPQWGAMPEAVADEQLEDLGWNDMGDADGDTSPSDDAGAQIVSINRGVLREANDDLVPAEAVESALIKAKPAPRKTAPADQNRPAKSSRSSRNAHRAAFTLRLDTERHLKLRLAATMQGMSAQSLVTEALDAMLAGIDDLDSIAARMHRN
ncbi:hypothetical protein [Qipengyuania sp. ASV99]|uniref:hypothetical protein n=1 Tax=Qipengyuania sp. ASV99 TaxID=3399681 RepID=UPI003A4C7284